MANEEHLARLKQGVEAWNAWREANPSFFTPDLREADLTGANLVRVDLRGANLVGSSSLLILMAKSVSQELAH